MKIVFFDCSVVINGCVCDEYLLEEGERVDFLCLSDKKPPFESFVYQKEKTVYSNDFDAIIDDTAYLFIKKNFFEFKIWNQNAFTRGFERILATAFFDGKNYLSIESDSNGYNLFRLEDEAVDITFAVDYYADYLFVEYAKNEQKALRIYSLADSKEIFSLTANEISLSDRRIDVVIRSDDILSRVIRRSFSVENQTVRQVSESVECADVHVCTDALLGVLFFESAVWGDKERMKSYLDEEMLVDFSSIFDEFSSISDFTLCGTKGDLFFVTRKGKKELYKIVVENRKISDILSN